MEPGNDAQARRASSTHSASSGSRQSAAVHSTRRSKPRKTASHISLARSAAPTPSDKSLTSFPSLSPSPEPSPVATRFGQDEPLQPHHLQPPGRGAVHTGPPTVRKASKPVHSTVGSLISAAAASLYPHDRSALFDDTPQDVRSVPGNLHHASDERLQRVLAKTGSIKVVRQLAEDLAQRDAQITALRRKAEERERMLRKMLQECEVSNLDIDDRLKLLERGSTPDSTGDGGRKVNRQSLAELDRVYPEDPIGTHLARAMSDENDGAREFMTEDDASPTASLAIADDRSVTSADLAGAKTAKGWKSYIWSGSLAGRKRSHTPSLASANDDPVPTCSRVSSAAARKPLSSDLFAPPSSHRVSKAVDQLRRLDSGDEAASISSRRSSGSVASWALRLVAGNNQSNREVDKTGSRTDRVSTNCADFEQAQRTPPVDLPKTSSDGKAKGRTPRTSLGPTGTIKKNAPPEGLRIAAPSSQALSPRVNCSLSTLGPVEMDMILPEESRPPALMPRNNYGRESEFLADPFGFIYDQQRKKRQAQATAATTPLRNSTQGPKDKSLGTVRGMNSNGIGSDGETPDEHVEEGNKAIRPASVLSHTEDMPPTKRRWQDYLRIATSSAELLSHTPVAAPLTAVIEEMPKPPQVTVQNNASFPAVSANPGPTLSVQSGAAEIAQPTFSSGPASPVAGDTAAPQPDPVKALLDQLTDVHNMLQRDKQAKWHEFLRKVRAQRKREGDAVAASEGRGKNNTMPETLLADGEVIGISGLGNKGKTGRTKWKEFKGLVLGGIPVSYRAKIWAECSGAAASRVPGYYEDLLANGLDDPVIVSQIQMDIDRTLTDNIFFRRGRGVQKLKEVLTAYARHNPIVGYCQGMNLITACLLLIIPTAEDVFWMLKTMIESILPESYYDHSLLASRADQVVLRQYVAELLPKLSAHFDELNIELETLTFQWFLSIFTDCLSSEALYRVWDVVLCMHDGSTFLFQVALALLKLNEKALIDCDSPGAVYQYINQQMTNHAISIDGLIQASDALSKVVRRKDVDDRRTKAMHDDREAMRLREEMRNERRSAHAQRIRRDNGSPPAAKLPHDSGIVTQLTPVTPTTASSSSSISNPASTDDDSDGCNDDENDIIPGDVERSLTPMPIDEEALWRA